MASNFFARQEQARQRSRWLVLAFAAAVVSILLLTNAVVLITVANTSQDTVAMVVPDSGWVSRNLWVVVTTSVVVVMIIAGASMYRMAKLSDGGGAVAQAMGGSHISSDVQDPEHRRLRNVVEEVALASGVPVPEIYVLEAEPGINAFAAGFSTSDAAIAVSRGSLEHLTRDELQGVIAHEFSHILNGDMRLNIRLIGALFGILVIGLAGRQILRVGRYGNNRKGAPLLLLGLALLIIGFAGLFFARLIQAAVSRQRETLADASAVQFTRNPVGIGGALKKIAALSAGSRLESADATEVSHMLFADGIGRQWFATHPPIEDRIRAIDPHFDRKELADLRARLGLGRGRAAEDERRAHPTSGKSLAGAGPVAAFAGSADIEVADLADTVGNPDWEQVRYAEALRESLDPQTLRAAHSIRTAMDLIFALLIDGDPAVRARQIRIIEENLGGDHGSQVEELLQPIADLDPRHRLPLVELTLPVLKRRPRSAIRIYLKTMEKLISADGNIDVFEFALSRLVRVYLIEAMNPRGEANQEDHRDLKDVREEISLVLAVLAQAGHATETDARRAFVAGWHHLFPAADTAYAPPRDWVDPTANALERIDELAPLFKEAVLEAMLETLSHDGRITLQELEMFRAICASLHCPMPPSIGD